MRNFSLQFNQELLTCPPTYVELIELAESKSLLGDDSPNRICYVDTNKRDGKF